MGVIVFVIANMVPISAPMIIGKWGAGGGMPVMAISPEDFSAGHRGRQGGGDADTDIGISVSAWPTLADAAGAGRDDKSGRPPAGKLHGTWISGSKPDQEPIK